MVIFKIINRGFHISRTVLSAETSLLATLRKKTGYTFSNCKKALQIHDNNLIEAEKWLKQQAQALGWAKATKLEGRQTLQGLIGVAMNKNTAVLVEVNCETDFVARNKEFQNTVQTTTESCLNFARNQQSNQNFLTKLALDSQQMKELTAQDGKCLADHLALMIGNVGENASLRRAFCLTVSKDLQLACYAHPFVASSSNGDGNILLGKFGGLVAFKQLLPDGNNTEDINQIGKEICQHIVGLNPKKIGNEKDEPAENKDEEICLIHQEFLLDDTVTVKDVLDENHLEICFFKRFECGENLNESCTNDEPLKFIETCQ